MAAEVGYLLEQRGELYALLDLDYLGWVGDHATGHAMMLRNLAAVAPNYRDLGVSTYVVAYFVRDRAALDRVRDALGVPLRVVRLSVPSPTSSGAWQTMSPAAGVMICVMRRPRSPGPRASALRTP